MTDLSSSSIIAIILARGGSKGVPRKNLRLFAGIPLIVHSIIDARESELVERVYVSTEDAEIADISRQYGAEIIDRPLELADDKAASAPALIHAVAEIEKNRVFPRLIVFLQCTCPLRTGQDIDRAIQHLQNTAADSLLSVSPAHTFLWEESDRYARSINYDYRQRPRRQDFRSQFRENGSIYIFQPRVLHQFGNWLGGKITLFKMGENVWDIDSLLDFKIAETIRQHNHHEN
jgi:N-acylneuraminate cytidylyltransferase